MKYRVLPRIGPVAVSTLVVLTLMVPTAYLAMPHIYRWRMLSGLHSRDESRLTQSLNFVATRAAKDERVLHGAVDRLGSADDAHFSLIATALEAAACWDRATVGDAAWLRWLGSVAASPQESSRIAAAQRLAELNDTPLRERLVATLRKLAEDASPDVRFNALIAAAELASFNPGDGLAAIIEQRTDDAEPLIARHALLLLPPGGAGMPGEPIAAPSDWQAVPARVLPAYLYALATHDPAAVLAAYRQGGPAIREAAVYALAQQPSDEAQSVLHAAAMESAANSPSLLRYRAILASQSTQGFSDMAQEMQARDDPAWLPLELAARYRVGLPPGPREEATAADPLRLLAELEGTRAGSVALAIEDEMPALIRLAAIRASTTADPSDLKPLLINDTPTLRDIAALMAAQKFTAQELEPLIVDLLTDYSVYAKMSGAVLAGMKGVQLDLLRKRYEVERMPTVRIVMRMSLWMAGDDHIIDATQARALLEREDLGVGSTVLLAMLHRGQRDPVAAREALDYLLNPRGELAIDLPEFFDMFRWWYVMEAYLPALFPEGHPPFWTWGDPELQAFQIDVLRNWYLLQRRTLTPTGTTR